MAAATSRPVVNVPAAGLLGAGVLAVISGSIYHISRPVFAFLLVKIVFLIIKLATWE